MQSHELAQPFIVVLQIHPFHSCPTRRTPLFILVGFKVPVALQIASRRDGKGVNGCPFGPYFLVEPHLVAPTMHPTSEKSPSAKTPKAAPSIGKARTILKHCAKSGNLGAVQEIAKLFVKGTFKIDKESKSTVELLADTLDKLNRKDHADFFRSTLCNLKLASHPEDTTLSTPAADQSVSASDAPAAATSAPPSALRFPLPQPPPPLQPGPAEKELERVLRAEIAIHYFMLHGKASLEWGKKEERENEVHIDLRIRLNREKEVIDAFQKNFKCPFSGYIVGHGCGSIKASASHELPHARVQALQQARESAARIVHTKFDTLIETIRLEASVRLERDVFVECEKWHRARLTGKSRELALSRVHELISKVDEGLLVGTRVFAFGSTTSGLALSSSDVDVSIVIPGLQTSEEDKGEDDFGAKDCRVCALRALERSALALHMKNVTLADRAKVPVLRYFDPTAEIDVDITVGNDSSILLSRFIRAHVMHDSRVWSLCMLVKTWAKNREVCGTMRKFINPLAWSVMTIFFLQHVVRPRVVDLYHVHRNGQTVGGDPTQAQILRMACKSHRGDGRNESEPGALLAQFFHFFGYEFDFKNEAISLNLTSRSSIVDLLGRKSSSALFIEQPLHLRENIVSYVDHQNMIFTISELKRAADICNVEGNLDLVLRPEYED